MENINEMLIKIPLWVVFQDVDEGAFIYHTQSENCFGLEGIGLEIWKLIDGGKTIKEINRIIHNQYDVDEDKVSEDVKNFIDELLHHKLLENKR